MLISALIDFNHKLKSYYGSVESLVALALSSERREKISLLASRLSPLASRFPPSLKLSR